MISRRRLLVGSAGLTLAAACTDRDGGGADPRLDLATRAARLERLVVDTYASTRTAAVQGRFGAAVPQALVELMTTAMGHHQEHLNTWSGLLAAGGRPVPDTPDGRLRAAVDKATVTLADIPGAAALLARLEDYVCRTYLDVLPTLAAPDLVRTVAQMLVVDEQHQAVLRYLLGLSPVGAGTSRDTIDVAPAGAAPDLLLSTP